MSECCNPVTSITSKQQFCPECHFICKPVSMTTLYHQVRFPENQTLLTNSYYFCSTKTCPIAYFSNRGNPIPKSHLSSYHAIQNEALCYCFDITAIKYVSALKAQCAEPIKNFVIQRTKTGECACEIRNPSGQCCLAHFKRLEIECR